MSESYTFRLSDAHRPGLLPGLYQLSVEWNVAVDGEDPVEQTEITQFDVAGERFSLKPSDIESVYPPEGSSADYSNSLPHIALTRDTLPWERSAKKGSNEPEPWLALLLFNQQEAEKCKVQTITLKTYKETLEAYPEKVTVDLGPGEAEDHVQVIELPADLSKDVLPTLREVKVLCHARATQNAAGKPATNAAIVVSKRLPAHGRNTAHLVALENRFKGDAFPFPPNPSKCLLISLKSWTFTCQAAQEAPETHESLEKLFGALNVGWPQLPSRNGTRSNYEEFGFVPLAHRFRTGETGASWYAGPLSCGVPIVKPSDAAGLLKLPAQSADDLLWYDEDLGMLNITYAAAWELGRLLAMQNRRILSLLHNWRRQQIHCAHTAKAAEKDSACCHIPQIQCAHMAHAPKAPVELTSWFDGLRKLQGIPYRYLLPDERLLPPESIRFVTLDQQYISALLDGVLSSVRAPNLCPEQCRQGEIELLGGNPGHVTGFLFRSAAVSGWPGLEVTAWGADLSKSLESYQTALLSPSIRLYLFRGETTRLTIRQRPDTIHLSVKDEKTANWSNRAQRVLKVSATSSSAFATEFLLEPPRQLNVEVTGSAADAIWENPV